MMNNCGTVMDYILYSMKGMSIYHFDPNSQFALPIYWFMVQIYAAYLVTYYAGDDYDANARNLFIASGGRSRWWYSKCLWCISTVLIYFAVYFISILFMSVRYSADMSLRCTPGFVTDMFTDTAQYLSPGNLVILTIVLPVLITVGMCLVQQILSFLVNPIVSFAIMSGVYVVSVYYTVWWLPGSYTMWLRSSMVDMEGVRPIIGIVLGCAMIVMSWVGGGAYFDSKDVL